MPGSVKARCINGGDRTAYILDDIRLEGNKMVFFSSLNDNFRSEVELPAAATAVSEPVDGIYNVDELMGRDFSEDCTAIVQELINEAYVKTNGGVIKFGVGIYNIRYITLLPKVKLEGCGMGLSVLRRIPNSVIDETEKDSHNNCKGFINIPADSYGNAITDLSIYGGSTYTANGNKPCNVVYSDSTPANGIFVYDNNINALTEDGNPADAYQGIVSDEVDTEVGGTRTQKFLEIRNVTIFGMYGSGIYVGAYNNNVTIDGVHVSHCRYDGIVNNGFSTCVSNVNLFANGTCGIYDGGSYNKYTNVEVDYTGRYDHYNSAGIIFADSDSCSLNNANVRLCYCSGYVITGNNHTLTACLSDSNGSSSSKDPSINSDVMNPQNVPHMSIKGNCHNINITVSNSRSATINPIANYSVRTYHDKNVKNSIINIIGDSYYVSNNYALINEVAINTLTVATTINDDTVVTYIPQATRI